MVGMRETILSTSYNIIAYLWINLWITLFFKFYLTKHEKCDTL
jgi:hypothetical protein